MYYWGLNKNVCKKFQHTHQELEGKQRISSEEKLLLFTPTSKTTVGDFSIFHSVCFPFSVTITKRQLLKRNKGPDSQNIKFIRRSSSCVGVSCYIATSK